MSLDSTPSTGLSVISVTPVSMKSLPAGGSGFLPSLAKSTTACDAHLGHLQRVLLRGRADDAVLDVLHARAAAVDGDDRDVLLLAGGLERLVRARGGGLVDRVDEVDRRVLLEQVLHRRAAALLGAVGHVVADDPRVGLVADLRLVADVDAEALEEALVALHVHRDAVGVEVEHRDLRLLAAFSNVPLAHLPIASAGGVVVGREGDVGGVGAARSACRARSPAGRPGAPCRATGTIAFESLGVIMRPFAPAEIRLSTAATCDLVVAVLLAREGLQLGAELLGLGVGALLHLHEERVRLGLGDQADLDVATAAARRSTPRCRRSRRRHMPRRRRPAPAPSRTATSRAPAADCE